MNSIEQCKEKEKEAELIIEGILDAFIYEPFETGEFFRVQDTTRGRVGSMAGYMQDNRRYIEFKGIRLVASRLAWRVYHGCWPNNLIDHINGDSSDNRIENLREADYSINNLNTIKHREASGADSHQIAGTHYQTAIEPWNYIHRNGMGYLDGNVIKYISRYKRKNGLQDLKKAQHYLEKLIEEYSEESISAEPGAQYVNQD